MHVIFVTIALLYSVAVAQAQFSKNFAAYVGYATFNEPNISLEYRVHKRLAVNLEGAGFIPYTKEMDWKGIFPSTFARINCYGGAIRTGISIYGRRRFGIMHRVMFDITYTSSGLYREMYGIQEVISDDFYREFMQYGLFYEITFRLFAKQKRHHLFLRAGVAARSVHRTVVSSHGPGYFSNAESHEFYMQPAPILSIGYRIRLHPQKDYFVGE